MVCEFALAFRTVADSVEQRWLVIGNSPSALPGAPSRREVTSTGENTVRRSALLAPRRGAVVQRHLPRGTAVSRYLNTPSRGAAHPLLRWSGPPATCPQRPDGGHSSIISAPLGLSRDREGQGGRMRRLLAVLLLPLPLVSVARAGAAALFD